MRNTRERGAALVVVLLLLAVMSIMVAEFAYAVRIQAALLANHQSRIQGRAAARAGQNAAAAILLRTNADNPLFNSPTTGIMLFRYQCMTSGNTDTFLSLVGGADFTSMTADERAKAAAPKMLSGGTAGQEGCGRWSLGLPYQLGDANLDIEVSDEQARLNLNAMVTLKEIPGGTPGTPGTPGIPGTPGTPGTPGAGTPGAMTDGELTLNLPYFCSVYELIRLQARVHKLEISDSDLLDMTKAILDYLDYGKIDGSPAQDKITTFEIDGRIVPMKDGPLDTVDEIRLVPGMTDELYDAVKDFFTVYPTTATSQGSLVNFNQQVNLNAAPIEVVYALIRGTKDLGDRCESPSGSSSGTLDNNDPDMMQANAFIQSNFPSASATTGGSGSTPDPAAAMANFDINRPGALPAPVIALKAPVGGGIRFYRVKVSAFMPDGLETVVIRVVKAVPGQSVQPLYYREE